MKLIYRLNGQYLWEVEEGSLMDQVLKDIQKRAQKQVNRECRELIRQGLPIVLKQKQHRDILLDVERADDRMDIPR